MSIRRKLIATAAVVMTALCTAAFVPSVSIEAEAASFSDINASSVFLKQQESDTCTLCANVMMLRRTAMMRGDSDWNTITEYSAKSDLWMYGVGMYSSYSHRGIQVTSGRIQYNAESELIALLKEHPEGVVAYDFDYPHAILLTDYTNGVFYCAEPANNCAAGRVKATEALVPVSGVEMYWVVTSPDVKLSGSSAEDPEKPEPTVSEYRKVKADGGLNIRTGAGTGYSICGLVPDGTTLYVTKKKTAGGYTWGYTTYYSVSGWVALEYTEKVSVPKLVNSSAVSSSSVVLGSTVNLNAKASGGTGSYQYAYYYRKSGASAWTTIKGYSTASSASFKLSKSGTWEVLIKVKDSNGSIAKKTITVKATAALSNNSSLSRTTAETGEAITLKGVAANGAGGYEYAYYYKKTGVNDWVTIKTYSSSSSVSFTPYSADTYTLLIKVRDKNGTIAKKEFSLKVTQALKNKSVISRKTAYTGDTITLKASAEGGAGNYQYAFYYKRPSDQDWITIQNYSAADKAEFRPLSAVEYELLIKVKDNKGKVEKKTFTLTVTKALSNQSALSAGTIAAGKTVTLKGAASGGAGNYRYAYYYKRSTASSWKTIKSYSTASTAVFVAESAGKYDLMIKVMDEDSTVAKKTFSLTVQ